MSLLLVSLVMVLLHSYIAIYPLAGTKKFPDILFSNNEHTPFSVF